LENEIKLGISEIAAYLAKKQTKDVKEKKKIPISQGCKSFETNLTHCQDCENHCDLCTITYNKQTYILGSRCGKY